MKIGILAPPSWEPFQTDILDSQLLKFNSKSYTVLVLDWQAKKPDDIARLKKQKTPHQKCKFWTIPVLEPAEVDMKKVKIRIFTPSCRPWPFRRWKVLLKIDFRTIQYSSFVNF